VDPDPAMRALLEDRAPLVGFIRAIVGSRSLAEDVFQELAILVMRKHADIPNPEAFPGWIRRAARFEARNALRKHSREHLAISEDVAELFERQAPEPIPTNLHIEALERCIELLSPAARTLVKLKYHQGQTGEEMSDHLGKPLNTIYVSLSRIHKALGQCVKSRLPGVVDV
jgi:RNA polymerase sigma-70 factor, ECF subfamily